MTYYVYDIETLYNFFSFTGKFVGYEQVYSFEISERRNERDRLLAHLNHLQQDNVVMVGFNSLGFDWPIVQELMTNPHTFTFEKARKMCKDIIEGGNYGQPTQYRVPLRERHIQQLDLVKLNHFDNRAKRTRLKDLEFAMRLNNIIDLPVPIDEPLTHDQMDKTLEYNAYDVKATEQFFHFCKPAIDMRHDLLEQGVLTGDVLNYSDVKIGVEYLIRKIGRNKCFVKGSTPKQTKRITVPLKFVVLPKISYRTDEFTKVKDWFKDQTIIVESRERPKLKEKLAGLDFHFGVGGVHACKDNSVWHSTDDKVIIDVDVSGMYPAVAVANGFAPEHLKDDFSRAYKQLSLDRKQYPKGTTMNAVLKLANNGVFGNSNNPYSCFYDPKFTFSITINGQLQLLQLVELLHLLPQTEIIQANTDGVTIYMNRNHYNFFKLWCGEWEKETGLVLEEVEYKSMWVRDVNNYMAVDTNGKIKRKGAYWYPTNWKEYEGWWNKNFSHLAVQKVTEAHFIHGMKPEDAVRCIVNRFDFMLRYKTRGKAKVYIGDKVQQGVTRYYISKSGEPMKKVDEPKGELGAYKRKNKLKDSYFNKIMSEIPEGTWDERIHTKNKSKYTIRETSIHNGWLVKECNDMSKFNWNDLNYDFYVEEIKKLLVV